MQATGVKTDRRRQGRIVAVLPVRVRGVDAAGVSFEELAHTLDLTATGVRLGAIRRTLRVLDTLTILYRQRRIEFTIVWTKLLNREGEYQIGLRASEQEKDPLGSLFSSSAQATAKTSTIQETA